MTAASSPEDTHKLLGIYLNDHLMGASGGAELFRRTASHHASTPEGVELTALALEVAADRESLRGFMAALGIAQSKAQVALGWVGEKAGRLKLNGHVLSRSPLSDVVELEGLRSSVAAKLAGWQALRERAEVEPRLSKEELDALVASAERQYTQLVDLHLRLVRRHFQVGAD